jgi:hypothetical protein
LINIENLARVVCVDYKHKSSEGIFPVVSLVLLNSYTEVLHVNDALGQYDPTGGEHVYDLLLEIEEPEMWVNTYLASNGQTYLINTNVFGSKEIAKSSVSHYNTVGSITQYKLVKE